MKCYRDKLDKDQGEELASTDINVIWQQEKKVMIQHDIYETHEN